MGIDALALAPLKSLEPRLAVGRANGAVELWDTTTWHLRSSCAGRPRSSIRSLVWIENAEGRPRLLSAGLHGEITEWDLDSLEQATSVSSGGGAVWALCADSSRAYMACDDGSVRIFDLAGGFGSVLYERRIPVAKARLLSIAVAAGSDSIFAGGSESRISKWSLSTGTCQASMQVEQANGGAHTLVWALACLADGSLASGDSLGLVQIWDPTTSVVLHRFQQHQADVLVLAASADGRMLLSGGIDAKIATFVHSAERWVFANAEFSHSHDIRAIACDAVAGPEAPQPYVAGGVAGRLFVHGANVHQAKKIGSGRPLECSSFSPFFQTASVAQASRLMLCQRDDHLELWYLQKPKEDCQVDREQVPEAQFLLRVALGGSAASPQGDGQHICSSAISPSGALFAASNMNGTRLFRLSVGELEVQREKGLPEEVQKTAARAMLFCGEAGLLAVTSWATGHILLLDCAGLAVVARFEEHSSPVSLLAAGGPGGEWLASADLSGAVHCFNLDGLQHQARVPLGEDSGFPTAIGFDGPGRLLIIAMSTHVVFFFDVEAQALAARMPAPASIPSTLLATHARICGIAAPAATPNKLVLWGHSFMLALTLKSPEEDAPAEKRTGKRSADEEEPSPGPLGSACSWKVFSGLKHLLSLCALSEAQWGGPLRSGLAQEPEGKKRRRSAGNRSVALVLSMEVSPEAAERALPPSFERKQYNR